MGETKLDRLEEAMKAADAEVTRLCRMEYERAEAARKKIANARQVAFRAHAEWRFEAQAVIDSKGAKGA